GEEVPPPQQAGLDAQLGRDRLRLEARLNRSPRPLGYGAAQVLVRSSGTHASAEVSEPWTPIIRRAVSGRREKSSMVHRPRARTSTSGILGATQAGTAAPTGPSRPSARTCARRSTSARSPSSLV